jgi:CheY-like chemotaxis protein
LSPLTPLKDKTLPKSIVLYADDDIDDLEFIKDAFLDYKDQVELITVSDGLEALEYLKNLQEGDQEPCLVVLDINMPRMDGKEALKLIREIPRFKQIPAILFTTSSQHADKEFAKKNNAGFLTKPIDYGELDTITSLFLEHCTPDVKEKLRK